jgi:hypothetical protein
VAIYTLTIIKSLIQVAPTVSLVVQVRGLVVMALQESASVDVLVTLLRYGQQLILKKIYHDPTRYLSLQVLDAINAQEGSFNVS